MGACYSVDLRYKVKNNDDALKALQKFIGKPQECGMNVGGRVVNFNLDKYRSEGVTTDTIAGCLRIILAGWKVCPYHETTDNDGFTVVSNDFDASYGWEFVMKTFIDFWTPFLEDGSSFYVEPDDNSYEYVVRDGKLVYLG